MILGAGLIPAPLFFNIMIFEKLASAILNDIVSGLQGLHTNLSLSKEQLIDDIVDERLQILKEYSIKGVLPVKDLLLSINCVKVDCKSLDKCSECYGGISDTPTAHFEIPQILMDFGEKSIQYIGTTDKKTSFRYSTSIVNWDTYNKYRKYGAKKPFVLIDTTPNENGMYDCFIFNAPLIKQVSIVAIFKDPRQLEEFDCCSEYKDDNFSFINNEIKKRLTAKKIQYYRQLATGVRPNDQKYS